MLTSPLIAPEDKPSINLLFTPHFCSSFDDYFGSFTTNTKEDRIGSVWLNHHPMSVVIKTREEESLVFSVNLKDRVGIDSAWF